MIGLNNQDAAPLADVGFIIIYLGSNTRIYKVDLSIIKFVEQKTTLRLKYIFKTNKNYDVYLFNFLYFY